jgi:hypothetical protein
MLKPGQGTPRELICEFHYRRSPLRNDYDEGFQNRILGEFEIFLIGNHRHPKNSIQTNTGGSVISTIRISPILELNKLIFKSSQTGLSNQHLQRTLIHIFSMSY